MAVDMAALNATIAKLTDQVAKTEGTEDSAVMLITGFADQVKAAVTAALVADEAATQVSVDAANAAVDQVTGRFTASGDKLGAAVAASPGPNPPPLQP